MAKGDHQFKRKPRGSKIGGYARPRVQIGFDPQQIKEISALAKADGKSFTTMVRVLVALGLIAFKGGA